MTAPQLRVLIVERQYVVRTGLSGILAEQKDVDAVHGVQSVPEALAVLRTSTYDVILIDLMSCHDGGFSAVGTLRSIGKGAKVLIFSDRSGDGDVLRAIQAGASGYLLKSATREEIVDAIRQLMSRDRFFPPEIAQCLAGSIGAQSLTLRELEVLGFVREGWRNRQIANRLAVAETTVNFHIQNSLSKLIANDRTHAVMIAIRRGLLPLCRRN